MKNVIFFINRDSEIYRVLEERNFELSPGSIFFLSKDGIKTFNEDFKVIWFEIDEVDKKGESNG